MMKSIIIEDEASSRLTLSNYLKKYCPNVEVVGEAEDIKKGKELILKHQPELVFLDVEMPFGNAFDLLESFDTLPFETIFVTAYSAYAMDALNLSASRYLLKPLNIDELIEAVDFTESVIQKKVQLKSSNILLENLKLEKGQLKKIVLPLMDGFEVVVIDQIVRCKACDNLTEIYLKDGSMKLVCRTLKFYEETLSNYDFVRIHRSHLININEVARYRKGNGGEVTLKDGTELSISSSRKESFLKHFI